MDQTPSTEEAIRHLRSLLDGNRSYSDTETCLADFETLAGDLLESAGLPRGYRKAAGHLRERSHSSAKVQMAMKIYLLAETVRQQVLMDNAESAAVEAVNLAKTVYMAAAMQLQEIHSERLKRARETR